MDPWIKIQPSYDKNDLTAINSLKNNLFQCFWSLGIDCTIYSHNLRNRAPKKLENLSNGNKFEETSE